MSNIPGRPFADSKITNFISKHIDIMAPRKSQREIAAEIGYDKANMLSMIKHGDSRVPLDKIPLLAKALEVDVATLFKLALEQYWPDMNRVIADAGIQVLTKAEKHLIDQARKLTEDQVPMLSEKQVRDLGKVLGK